MARHLSPGVVGEEGVDLIVGVDVRRHELARSAREREGGDDHGHEEGVDEPVSNLVTIPPKSAKRRPVFLKKFVQLLIPSHPEDISSKIIAF